MHKILTSACLLGQPVRYDGRAKPQDSAILARWRREGRLVAVCPEVQAGLATPRAPAEIQGGGGVEVLDGDARVVTVDGWDVTPAFLRGARLALDLCRAHDVRYALLTETSPSCGSGEIHDGRFAGRRAAGAGVTTALLERHGVRVFPQHQIESLAEALAAGERARA
ncbi:DUF523 domain-containing protein [Halomonas nitroreducens]|uniref:DUF523 domain-containing protein n=1 Tax=Halomonas nitroreducens TaxID=447425 RepID=A0A431V4F8_9GAMM|nr:DUF523 domain-containing protein [Halomonas nitroreducens]RTR05254.1 DUF523 domain-containing protein [Halomonas nitroreducens]